MEKAVVIDFTPDSVLAYLAGREWVPLSELREAVWASLGDRPRPSLQTAVRKLIQQGKLEKRGGWKLFTPFEVRLKIAAPAA